MIGGNGPLHTGVGGGGGGRDGDGVEVVMVVIAMVEGGKVVAKVEEEGVKGMEVVDVEMEEGKEVNELLEAEGKGKVVVEEANTLVVEERKKVLVGEVMICKDTDGRTTLLTLLI
ncbi:hypothetical protein GH714_032865 [Hevea brasiliensis]|uniref:Uncharacterized protein n=1 Tax=Hevea brasiliensis TaxID=3981 RepID=A0A6A6LWG8_HEVBR|nr:hypothetical protein GH714_032865 [Hevea brasiliensis]